MKNLKILILIMLIIGLGVQVTASALCPQPVRHAISKYKAQDYVGCIQDLKEYSELDPTNAVAYYYSALAYMKVGMKQDAINAFRKVSTINSVPVLSSYSIQAVNCMNSNISPCVYKNYSKKDIEEMVANPGGFFERKAKEAEEKIQNGEEIPIVEDITDIDRLIQGEYPENIHPEASRVIQETRLLQEQERVNSELKRRSKPSSGDSKSKSDAGTLKTDKIASAELSDKEIADAVRTLSKAGYKFTAPDNNSNINPYKQMAAQYSMNDDAAQMALMFGGNNNNRNNSFDAMLPYLLMQDQQNADGTTTKRKLDPELVKTIMMNQMMGDFDLGLDNNKNK